MFAVIDVETTGGQVMEDRVTEIAIFITDGKEIIDSYTTLVNPEKKIMPFVQNLTGITDEMVADAPLFTDIADKIEELTKDTIFVAHNIGFDYSIIRKEFKRIGRTYRRPNLCTVKLSQKTIKNQPSYSLGTLSKNLGFEIENRHRAYGDAEATVMLLHKIIEEQGMEYVEEFGNQQTHLIDLKGALTKKMIDELPEEPGLFRFIDKHGTILYVSAAKNIFAEVTKFLINEIKTPNFNSLYQEIASIDTQVIHNYFFAEIQEIEEIRSSKPKYNKSGIYKSFPVGIYEYDRPSSAAFYIDRNPNGSAVWRFQTEKTAKRFLRKVLAENGMNMSTHLNKPVSKNYLEKVEKALQKKAYPHRNFLIVKEVSFANLFYVIVVQNYIYQGYAVIDSDFFDGRKETIFDNLVIGDNNPYTQKIIQRYLRKKKNYDLIPF